MSNTVKLEIITPADLIYKGDIELVSAPTVEGNEGYMPGHTWCCKLLQKEGQVRIKEPGDNKVYIVNTKGGYVEIRDYFIIYAEDAAWEGDKPKGAATILDVD